MVIRSPTEELTHKEVLTCVYGGLSRALPLLPAYFEHCGLRFAPPNSVPRWAPFRLPLDTTFPFSYPVAGAPAPKRIPQAPPRKAGIVQGSKKQPKRKAGSRSRSSAGDSGDEDSGGEEEAHDGTYIVLTAPGDLVVRDRRGHTFRRRPVPKSKDDSMLRAIIRACDMSLDAAMRDSSGRLLAAAEAARELRDVNKLAATLSAVSAPESGRQLQQPPLLQRIATLLGSPIEVYGIDPKEGDKVFKKRSAQCSARCLAVHASDPMSVRACAQPLRAGARCAVCIGACAVEHLARARTGGTTNLTGSRRSSRVVCGRIGCWRWRCCAPSWKRGVGGRQSHSTGRVHGFVLVISGRCFHCRCCCFRLVRHARVATVAGIARRTHAADS